MIARRIGSSSASAQICAPEPARGWRAARRPSSRPGSRCSRGRRSARSTCPRVTCCRNHSTSWVNDCQRAAIGKPIQAAGRILDRRRAQRQLVGGEVANPAPRNVGAPARPRPRRRRRTRRGRCSPAPGSTWIRGSSGRTRGSGRSRRRSGRRRSSTSRRRRARRPARAPHSVGVRGRARREWTSNARAGWPWRGWR